MKEQQKETFISWLNDAYAMEQSLVKNLGEQAKDAEEAHKSEAATKISDHIEKTKHHAEVVKSCIERLGGNVSKSKTAMSKMQGAVGGKMMSMSDDVLVKDVLSGYTAENMEIASYTSLISAANELGDTETAEACEEILKDEQDMAQWLLQQIPVMTHEYLVEASL